MSLSVSLLFCLSFFLKKLFIFYFWLYWVFIDVQGLSLAVVHGLLTVVTSLVLGPRFRSCGTWA